MTLRLGVVGMGHIAPHHVAAITATDGLELACTCDLRPRRPVFDALRVPHFLHVSEMLDRCPLDIAVIATPPATHCELASRSLSAGVDVLLEKPATLDRPAYETLLAAAETSGHSLDLALHAAFGREMVWFETRRDMLYERYGPPVHVACQLHDPYVQNGCVSLEAASMGGCWRDSSINALSVLNLLLPLNQTSVREACLSALDAQTDLHVIGVVHLMAPSCDVVIETNWLRGENLKKTFIQFADREASLLLHHSGEYAELTDGSGTERISLANGRTRLANHYNALFLSFADARRRGDGFGPSARLHELMFDALELNSERSAHGR